MDQPIHELWESSVAAFIAYHAAQKLTISQSNEITIAAPADLKPSETEKNVGRLEKIKGALQEEWNKPDVRKGVGTAAYGGAILLIAGAATALILHFTTGQILGIKIPITYPVMLASFSSLAVLKGLQFREEATLIRQQEQKAPSNSTGAKKAEPVIKPLTDSKHEQAWKAVALIGGVAMIALFGYQMARFFNGGGSTALSMRAVSLVPAVGILSHSAALVNQFLSDRKRNGKTPIPKKLEQGEEPRTLKKRRGRLAPDRFTKVTIVGGGLIVLTALAALIARYGFGVKGISIGNGYTPLSLSNIATLGLSGVVVSGSGALAIGLGRDEEDIAAQDERIETLRKKVKKLKLKEPEYEQKAMVKKAVGTLAIAAGIMLFAMQLWGFDSASFRRVFGTAIKTDFLSFAAVLTAATGIAAGGVALIKNAEEHRQDKEEAALERILKKAE